MSELITHAARALPLAAIFIAVGGRLDLSA
jgi:hypothetical protein